MHDKSSVCKGLSMTDKTSKGPGKHYRNGISLVQVANMFATDEKATRWFERWTWPDGEIACTRCGSIDGAYRVKSGKPMPYRCRDCRKYFSLKIGTAMEGSPLPLRTWGWAIYLEMTSLKGVSSMKLYRDLGVTQKTAWFMLHRIREAFADVGSAAYAGPVEVDETYVGCKRVNMPKSKRKDLTGRGPVGKTAVVGAKDRETGQVTAKVVESVDGRTLNTFVDGVTDPDAEVFTDGSTPGPTQVKRGETFPQMFNARGKLVSSVPAGTCVGLRSRRETCIFPMHTHMRSSPDRRRPPPE